MKYFSLLFRSLLLLFVLVTIVTPVFAFYPVDADPVSPIMGFFTKNWSLILLIISEILAVIPAKESGIIHVILRLITKILAKKSGKRRR